MIIGILALFIKYHLFNYMDHNKSRNEYFEVLGESFSKIGFPRMYNMYRQSPQNLEAQLSSIAKAWHNDSIGSASRCFESDIQLMCNKPSLLIWLPDNLERFFGQKVYTCSIKGKDSFHALTRKAYETAGAKLKKVLGQSKGKPFFHEALHTEANIDFEGILTVPERYSDIFSYYKEPVFEIINDDCFIIHFNHEN